MTLLQKLRNNTGKIAGGLLLLYTAACKTPPPVKGDPRYVRPVLNTRFYDRGVALEDVNTDDTIDGLICLGDLTGTAVAVDTAVNKRFNEKLDVPWGPIIMDSALIAQMTAFANAHSKFAYYLDSTIYAQRHAQKKLTH